MRFLTFRSRLILWYSSLLAIIIILFGFAVFGVVRFTLISAVDSTLEETAGEVLQSIYNGPALLSEFGGRRTLFVQMPELDLFRASSVYVQVWQRDAVNGGARLAAASRNLDDFDDPVDEAALGAQQATFSNVVLHGSEGRVLTQPVVLGGQFIGNVQVAASLETVNQATDRFLGLLLISLGVAITGSVGLGMLLSTRALNPINRLTQAAYIIAETDDLSTRLQWNGPQDELGRLVSVFNQMMARLEHLFSVQQRFVADVSHELRTPLTAIRGNFELIKRYGMEADLADAIEGETARMTRMVEDLLLLAKADYGGMKIELGTVDLDTVIYEVYRQTRVLAKDRDLKISIGELAPLRVHGDADRIKQLLLNLVGNALKFTPDGGSITLALREQQGSAIMQVSDTGIGIKPQDQAHIFDRFFQADESRTRRGEGSGLGLSIARWISEAHGGTIHVASEPGDGTIFTVALPIPDTLRQTVTNRPEGNGARTAAPPGPHRRRKTLPES